MHRVCNRAFLSLITLALFATASHGQVPSTAQPWKRFEGVLQSTTDLSTGSGNPYRDVLLRVTFTQTGVSSPQRFATYGFWDGGRTFKIRATFPPNTSWSWATTCSLRSGSPLSCAGLTQSGGPISVGRVAAAEKMAIYRQGLLKAPTGGRFLTYADGTSKFFWLGDTAWVAPILGTDAEWQTYVLDRGKQDPATSTTAGTPAFSVIQMGVAPLWGDMTAHIGDSDPNNDLPKDRAGRVPFEKVAGCSPTTPNAPNDCMRWKPDFFRGFDARVEAANQQGLVVLIAGLMEPLDETDMMTYFPAQAEAQIFARNLVARLAGNHAIYSPGNDTRLSAQNLVSLAQAVGGTIRDSHCFVNSSGTCTGPRQLITYHPGGAGTVAELRKLDNETWLSFQLFQSGHAGYALSPCLSGSPSANDLESCRKAQLQELASRARAMPQSLVYTANKKSWISVNGEATYEGNTYLTAPDPSPNHSAYRARQTAYLSLLSGASGYTFGVCGLFEWGCGAVKDCPADPATPGHGSRSDFRPASAPARPSSKQMRRIRQIFELVSWERLVPQATWIKNQATQDGQHNDTTMVLAADGTRSVVAYVPDGQTAIEARFAGIPQLLSATSWPSTWSANWYNPRNFAAGTSVVGNFIPATSGQPSTARFRFPIPPVCGPGCDARDWVLVLRNLNASAASSQAATTASRTLSAWGDSDDDGTIFSIRGSLQPLGATESVELAVSSVTATPQHSAQIAREPGGRALIVWVKEDETGDGDIYARLFDPNGAPVGSEFRVNTIVLGDQRNPSVAAFADGGFVVAWDSRDDDAGSTAIYAQRFDGSAQGLTWDDRVECNGGGVGHPLVGTDSMGGFTVVWERSDPAFGTTDLRGQTFTPFGDPQGVEFRAGASATQAGLDSLAMPDGLNPLVTWRDLSAAAVEATGESAPMQQTASIDFVPSSGETCR